MKIRIHTAICLTLTLLAILLLVPACKKKKETNNNNGQSETIALKNDSYQVGDTKAFQGGFVAGEGAAVVLGPINKAFKLNKIMFLFGGSSVLDTAFTLRIYKDTGAASPGALLFENDFVIRTSDDSLRVLDLGSNNLRFSGVSNIRVLVLMKGSGYPSVAIDKDGTIADTKNWIYTSSAWTKSSILGLTGDWIIRAEIVTEP